MKYKEGQSKVAIQHKGKKGNKSRYNLLDNLMFINAIPI